MNQAEFAIVMKIAERADGGCPACVQGQFEYLGFHFPEFQNILSTRYIELYSHPYPGVTLDIDLDFTDPAT